MKIGIDLGTSYSSAAVLINGKIETIRVSTGASAFGDSFSMPTAVYMDNGQLILGQAALNKRKMSPSSFKNEFKRDLGTSTPYIIGGEEYLPEQLYTEILLHFKNQAIEQMGEKVEKAYITHPANYGNNKKRLIEKAANNAGLFDVVLVDEPTAAAAGYSQKNKVSDGDILLVYDLGGGTFDTALIKKTADGYVHLTEPLGISQCGGIDFDRVIFEDIIHKMSQSGQFDIERIMKEKRFTASLSEICIQIKHQLSQVESHTEPIAVGFDYFEYTITRDEFESFIRPFVTNTCEKIKDILHNSGLVASDIDRVLLVGGSSRVPLVRRMAARTLDKDISFDADPELAICRGAVSLENVKGEKEISSFEDDKKEKEHDEAIKKDAIQSFTQIIRFLEENRSNELLKQQSSEDEQRKVVLHKFVQVISCIKNKKDYEFQHKSDKQKVSVQMQNSKSSAGGEVMSEQRLQNLKRFVELGRFASDGQWIYYFEYKDKNTLYKVRTDGTQKTKLSSRSVAGRVIENGEWVYYQVNPLNMKYTNLYRISKSGTSETKISDEKIYEDYAVDRGWIYFIQSECTSLKKMRTNGSNVTVIINDMTIKAFVLNGDWIYYYKQAFLIGGLHKIRTDGTGRIKVCTCQTQNMASNGEWIYYADSADDFRLWKINRNGTQRQRVCDSNTGYINIVDPWVYYYNQQDKNVYRIRINGNNPQIVK